MTSKLSRLAKYHEDCANIKSPARTAIRVPNRRCTVCLPATKPADVSLMALRHLSQNSFHESPVSFEVKSWLIWVASTCFCGTPREFGSQQRRKHASLSSSLASPWHQRGNAFLEQFSASSSLGFSNSYKKGRKKLPRLVSLSSRTSSWIRLAVWIISVTSASRRCCGCKFLNQPRKGRHLLNNGFTTNVVQVSDLRIHL